MILETAVQGNKVMQDFELESPTVGVDHSQKVKATPTGSDYGLKGCVNLLPSTAVSRMIQETPEYRLAKLYALRRLSKQSVLSIALAKSLRQRLMPEEVIELLIAELTESGYLNDEEWVEGYVRGQARRKVGPRAIAAKLMHKGVDKDQFESTLSPLTSDEDQKRAILELLSSKYKRRDLKDYREKQKVIASLVRRGFSLDVIYNSLQEIDRMAKDSKYI